MLSSYFSSSLVSEGPARKVQIHTVARHPGDRIRHLTSLDRLSGHPPIPIEGDGEGFGG